MEVELPKEITKKISKVSLILGLKNEEVVNRAVLFYLDAISKQLELKKELDAWDYLSDEALIKFDKSI